MLFYYDSGTQEQPGETWLVLRGLHAASVDSVHVVKCGRIYDYYTSRSRSRIDYTDCSRSVPQFHIKPVSATLLDLHGSTFVAKGDGD